MSPRLFSEGPQQRIWWRRHEPKNADYNGDLRVNFELGNKHKAAERTRSTTGAESCDDSTLSVVVWFRLLLDKFHINECDLGAEATLNIVYNLGRGG